jgi:hypothetical protein
MSVSESCGCGASFSAERNDEVKMLNDWRNNHKCRERNEFMAIDNARSEVAPEYQVPEMHIGFRGRDDDDDDENRRKRR